MVRRLNYYVAGRVGVYALRINLPARVILGGILDRIMNIEIESLRIIALNILTDKLHWRCNIFAVL